MIKIGTTIVEDELDLNNKEFKKRETVRGICIRKNDVLVLHSDLYNDYIFPGGGIKNGEDHEQTLIREMKEETGASKVWNLRPVGYTEELRFGLNLNGSVYQQISYFYLCNIDDIGELSLTEKELNAGLNPVWVNIEDVLQQNDQEIKKVDQRKQGFKTVLVRENRVLRYVKENYL